MSVEKECGSNEMPAMRFPPTRKERRREARDAKMENDFRTRNPVVFTRNEQNDDCVKPTIMAILPPVNSIKSL